MKTRSWSFLAAGMLLAGLVACAEDKGEKARIVKLPVTGLKAGCCDSAVQDAVKGTPGVASVGIESGKDAKWAVVTLKKDASLSLAKFDEALAKATKEMGKGMGTEYKLDRNALNIDATAAFRTGNISDEDKAKLDKALGAIKGFEKSAVAAGKDGSTLTLTFAAGATASLEQVSKILSDSKVEVKDVEFAGTAGEAPKGDAKDEKEGGCCK